CARSDLDWLSLDYW
nr:immunoglobulin heavy chain junction region [Macaca mulatta]MOX92290.1 immunoglobulin heavy chain junction region [Macaca mulatta]MOX92391.1 immunoglobulin heavy chain junction region [Macaca mulatta]MOX92842.1 immunoglobulin heavy chain junction region [Macaca mulatta]MOX92980.1 immunoglobulin heavy chain junction region [Macaca mulatta]